MRRPVCLTIAGLDPSGGAGIIADIRTFEACGCSAAAALTSVTFQNGSAVFGATHQTADAVRRQIEAVIEGVEVAAVKTGMLPTWEIVDAVAAIIRERGLNNVVVDPVVRSTSGYELTDEHAVAAMMEQLFPLAELVTPNLPEAQNLAGVAIGSDDDIADAAEILLGAGARNVLIKGGHFLPAEQNAIERTAVDRLFTAGGHQEFTGAYIEGVRVRGTGCMLSSAIAANLALGNALSEAVAAAKDHVARVIRVASAKE